MTIPKTLRDRLGLRPGQVLVFQEERGRLVATKEAPQYPVQSVYGILRLGRRTDAVIKVLRGTAEAGSFFLSPAAAREPMQRLGAEFSPISLEAALAASTAWKRYRSSGGRRQRVAADFLIGAHALVQADRLLTRDRGFYRSYFAGLRLLDPAKG